MHKFYFYLTTLFFVMFSTAGYTQEKPETTKEKFSYAIGIQLAQNIVSQAGSIDTKFVMQAINDMLAGSEPRITYEEMQAAADAYQEEQMAVQSKAGEQNRKAGQEFLAANGKKEGIVTLESGLQYKIMTAGNGKTPLPIDSVVVHYRGALLDGTEFDSSYSRGEPLTISLNQVIPGWTEAVSMMPVGSKWQIYVPSELGYGERGAGANIGPHSTLIFDIELIGIN
jgi:FKBP-type peptidyl-prolyl cis-trans isomerase FklB